MQHSQVPINDITTQFNDFLGSPSNSGDPGHKADRDVDLVQTVSLMFSFSDKRIFFLQILSTFNSGQRQGLQVRWAMFMFFKARHVLQKLATAWADLNGCTKHEAASLCRSRLELALVRGLARQLERGFPLPQPQPAADEFVDLYSF